MDVLIELIASVLGQLAVEGLLEGAARLGVRGALGVRRALGAAVARAVVGATVGLAAGLAWGAHLSGGSTHPRLLWVSLGLAVTASLATLARGRRPALGADGRRRRRILSPPWRWDRARLLSFAVINAALAAGILTTFRRGS